MKKVPFLIHKRFEAIARKNPNDIAVQYDGKLMSYIELENLSNQFAEYLINSNVQQGDLVGLCVDRSFEMIASILAILKLGAGYMPIDPTYPIDRVDYMICSSEVKIILGHDKYKERYDLGENCSYLPLSFAKNENSKEFESYSKDGLIYVIYTSGSTGRPKGVSLYHSCLEDLFQWLENDTLLLECKKTLQFSPLSFDPSFMEIFSTLINGKTLVLVDEETRKDPKILLDLIISESIERLYVPVVILNAIAEEAIMTNRYPSSVKEVNCGGDTMKINADIVNFFEKLNGAHLNNQYGPTEASIMIANMNLKGSPKKWPELPAIGNVLPNIEVKIVDENFDTIKSGEVGEIFIQGRCLAKGYWLQDELTREKFIIHESKRYYRTGDLASFDRDGLLHFSGRIDDQVKLNGIRIELGEVEGVAVEHEKVKNAAAVVLNDNGIDRYILFYEGNVTVEELKVHLVSRLPSTMIPNIISPIEQLPLTPNGKIDKKKLTIPKVKKVKLKISNATDLEKSLLSIWSDILKNSSIGIDDNFFDVGGTSLMAIKVISKIRNQLSDQISIANFYQYPNIRKCSKFLNGEVNLSRRSIKRSEKKRRVAVIGMAGKFPGAKDLESFWDMIINKKEGITFFEKNELDPSIPEAEINDPNYVKARGYLPDAGLFDSSFFGMTPLTGEMMDPQIRLMLEYSKRALDNSGNAVSKTKAKIGVFTGMSNNSYYPNNVLKNPDKVKIVGEWTVATFNEKDYIATQVAHKLGLTGPAISLHTACSTSLVAIVQAIKAIEAGDCDMALSGGVNIDANPKTGYLFQEGNIRSKDGHCRPYDSESSGTIFCDGIGVVVLKDLELAIEEHDHIYGIVSGTGINNDGNDKVSFTAPSVNGQKEVIEMALDDGSIDPRTIELVEGHGTATPVGDPIEIEAIVQAWNVKDHKAVLGSVKGNIGHTIGAAGVAGFIKAILSVDRAILPATNHFKHSNKQIDFSKTPFSILTKSEKWNSKLRRAGVSAFGVGGTNAHVIIENYRREKERGESNSYILPFPFSAKSKSSLSKTIENFRSFYMQSEHNLEDISYTLCQGREDYIYKKIFFAKTKEDLLKQLEQSNTGNSSDKNTDVLFAFPGQGAQYLGMGYSLYEEFPLYKEIVDYCCEFLIKSLGLDLRDVLFHRKDKDALENTYYTQPAIFITEYALAKLLESIGVYANVCVGHSVGEFAAAVIAEVMSLDTALLMISKRAELMKDLAPGSMLSVRLSEDSIKKYLSQDIQLAAVNAPSLVVLAGADEAIDKIISQLEFDKVVYRKLHTSHAFHSNMMISIVPIYADYIKKFKFNEPKIKIYSSLLDKWVTNEMCDFQYWAKHISEPVLFRNAIEYLSNQTSLYTLIELGPRNTLATLAQMQLKITKKSWDFLSVLPDIPGETELAHFYNHLGKLWESGKLDLTHFYKPGKKVALPEYSFDYRNLWLDSSNKDNINTMTHLVEKPSMETIITNEIVGIIKDASGFSEDELNYEETFISLGFDSLLLTQVALDVAKRFNCSLSFRQLMDDISTIVTLSAYIQSNGDKDILNALKKEIPPEVENVIEEKHFESQVSYQQRPILPIESGNQIQNIINQQLELMRQQMNMLSSGHTHTSLPLKEIKSTTKNKISTTKEKARVSSPKGIENVKANVNTAETAFGAQARISTKKEFFDAKIEDEINKFISRYVRKTSRSKDFTQKYRAVNSDPRVVTGFRPEIKEMIYPLVVNKSSGQHLWDIDGNEYIDMICGFGSNFFGNKNPRITEALHEQLENGFEIGPQHELVGECAELICEFTGLERAAFCNTGSEAVLGAIRTARAMTGRTKVIMFTGSYHGINDEVIVRGLKDGTAMPAAAGISKEAVKDLILIEYGTDESYRRIEEEIDSIACVITESVQSRRPEFRPVEFLKKVRKLTEEHGVALIFDEVITGFRNRPGGAQEYYGIKADIATYGKIVGAGMPIGVIAGSPRFMDALDGGFWEYGDDSTPTVGVTYFAGTFVRHPLALRAMREALLILKEAGEDFYNYLKITSEKFVNEINDFCELSGAPIRIEHFGGVLKPKYTNSEKNNDIFYAFMRFNGVHVWDGFPWFITMAHTKEDLDFVVRMFKKSVLDMQEIGLFSTSKVSEKLRKHFLVPPIDGARLGKDANGNPAWFIEDKENPGQFSIVEKV